MKPITLHPLSLAIGFALAAGTLGLLAAQTVSGSHAIPAKDVRALGYVPAEQWTYARIAFDAQAGWNMTYQVPADSHFVITDYLLISGNSEVLENGVPGLADRARAVSFNRLNQSGTRVLIQPGTLLAFPPNAINAQVDLWGYLEPIR